jgi:hypothetical protein
MTAPIKEHWDFRECPEDELEACLYYEYARELDWVIAFYNNSQNQDFDNTLLICPYFVKYEGELVNAGSFHLPSRGFPRRPYLCLPQVMRNRIKRKTNKFNNFFSKGNRPIEDKKGVLNLTSINANIFLNLNKYSKKEIKDDFARWLDEFYIKSNIIPLTKRGQRTDSEYYQLKLKELSVYRLTNHFKGSLSAMNYLVRINLSLYENESDWSVALSNTKAKLCSLFES